MKKIKEVTEQLKKNLFKIKNVRWIVVFGFAGMVLILLSELMPSGNKKSEKKEKKEYSISDYSLATEQKIENLLSKIEGVGKVKVMLTVKGTEEYIYAQENKSNISENGESKSSQSENGYIFVQNSGNKEALVCRVLNPEISGVVVVCEGGGNSVVKEHIYNAVSVSLNIASNKIYVAKLE